MRRDKWQFLALGPREMVTVVSWCMGISARIQVLSVASIKIMGYDTMQISKSLQQQSPISPQYCPSYPVG
jgi:hypothetical protein